MKIWVDLANAPQVLFMHPLIVEMKKRGYEVIVTTRKFTETIGLADRLGLDHIPIGSHGGKTMFGKAVANVMRAMQLTRLARSPRVFLAVSSSYSQAIASVLLHIPMIALGDYEGQPANHIICRIAKRFIVPNVLNKANLYRYGATDKKILSYSGIKEEAYLANFEPDPGFREKLGIPVENILATMRPPSRVSTYHRFDNTVFDQTVKYVTGCPNTVVVLLPRGSEQRHEYDTFGLPNLIMPSEVIDGPQLVYCSDLVIGAGGTMNREATVFGTPVYTQFQGKRGSIDEHLISQGKMARVVDIADIPGINVCKKRLVEGEPWKKGSGLVQEIVDKILM
jgi:predicted glycosyltransferase